MALAAALNRLAGIRRKGLRRGSARTAKPELLRTYRVNRPASSGAPAPAGFRLRAVELWLVLGSSA